MSNPTINMQELMFEINDQRRIGEAQRLMFESLHARRMDADRSLLFGYLVIFSVAWMILLMAIRVERVQAESAAALDRSEALLAEVRAGLDHLELETRGLPTRNLPTAGGAR